MNDPLLPMCMPREDGGEDTIWKKKNVHLIKPIDLCSLRIQCIEIKENSNSNILLSSVYWYLPAKSVKVIYQNTKT